MTETKTGSVLTPTQREWLRGEKEDTEATYDRDLKRRIGERMRVAIEDLSLILRQGLGEERFDVESQLTKEELPEMWALPALMFLWTRQNKVATRQLFSDTTADESSQRDMNRRTAMLDLQIENGIESVLEFDPPDRVVNNVNSSVTVEIGPQLSEVANEDLAALPRRYIERLFRAGQLTPEEYGEVMKERFERVEAGELDPRPPVGVVDPDDIDDLGQYLDRAVRAREQDESDSPDE